MSGLYRSQAMEYVSVTMTTEAARLTVHTLGQMNKIHVVDLSDDEIASKQHSMHKKYVVKCGTMQRKLQNFEEEMEKLGVNVPLLEEGRPMPGLQDVLAEVESFIQPITDNYVSNLNFVKENRAAICFNEEWIEVLKACKGQNFDDSFSGDVPPPYQFSGKDEEKGEESLGSPLLSGGLEVPSSSSDVDSGAGFRSSISGTIPLIKKWLFARALYRISRGNAIVQFFDLPDGVQSPVSDDRISKSVFNIMIIGKELEERVCRMCASYDAIVYKTPASGQAADRLISEKTEDNLDKRLVLAKTKHQLVKTLENLAWDEYEQCSPLRDWQQALLREKGMHAVLMKAHFTQNLICIEGWVPAKEINRMRQSISGAFQGSSMPAPAFEAGPQNPLGYHKTPPTYFDTGSITSIFQGIVDTYGIGRYQEANPGIFTIITFPFLFGVMYGDVGHGLFLMLGSLFMIYKEKELLEQQKRGKLSELISMPFSGRYMLLMMSFFAIYCGFIYNDCMSMPIFLFESRWSNIASSGQFIDPKHVNSTLDGVYPFGIDPEWYYKSNDLEFMNSFKMKLAVVLGVTQMMFGVFLGGTNHVYFKDHLSLFFEWIPQVLFLGGTFGYMVFLIFLKWCIPWNETVDITPPGILQIMLKFFLSPGTVADTDVLYGHDLQLTVQTILFILAMGSVPVMLLVKPLVLRHRMNNASHAMLQNNHVNIHIATLNDDIDMGGDEPVAHPSHDDDDDEHSFGDIMVHQIIHTIEYVLGAISNTASYLRLWALSLAHSQLAGVFWKQLIENIGLQGNGFTMFIAFGAWFVATFAVLLCMDTLECFLHALRLHWVEFQNKFYRGDGYKFVPFNFEPEEE